MDECNRILQEALDTVKAEGLLLDGSCKHMELMIKLKYEAQNVVHDVDTHTLEEYTKHLSAAKSMLGED